MRVDQFRRPVGTDALNGDLRSMPQADHYTHIIVGAGSAGSVLALRLSEDKGVRVLVLEAGREDHDPLHRTPGTFLPLLGGAFNWGYLSVPQAALGKPVAVPRGRGYGGSSAVNANVYLRGTASDYDGWRDEYGADGWGWDDVLPYFRKAERNSRLGDDPYHGADGPLRVEDGKYVHPVTSAWVAAAVNAGLKHTDDFNGKRGTGAGIFQSTVHDGRRWSAADAYLRPALLRSNVRILAGVTVGRVVLEGRRAVGVAYLDGDGDEGMAWADGEVVIAAGAINSPQVLLLSGIGPRNDLEQLGIHVNRDLPGVGQNLQDHPAFPLISSIDTADVPTLAATAAAAEQFERDQTGPLASTFAEAGALVAFDGNADAEIEYMTGAVALGEGLPELTEPVFTNVVMVAKPRSRGTVRIVSRDPAIAPAIDPAIYADPDDLEVMLEGVQRAISIASHQPFAAHVTGTITTTGQHPSEEQLAADVLRWSQTTYHPTSTCAMGTGAMAVVDPTLRVHGFDNLRVVDASVMPAITRGNTNAPTIMIAEKAADLIKETTRA
ncbi:GMC family oxidoreductase [Curtobacterium flaccumfaciens pv. flaccumfaciens]|uniref:GMC family oxidoreductase n=1 Tax=Curtobacterium flaccumfaciens TaxID=2035 RepID=UPI003AB7E539